MGIKLTFLRVTGFAIAIYGCGSWALTKMERHRFTAFEMWAYQMVLRDPWTARHTNMWMLSYHKNKVRIERTDVTKETQLLWAYYATWKIMRHGGFDKDILLARVSGFDNVEWCTD